MRDQTFSLAERACWTARLMSSAFPAATWQRVASVAGLMMGWNWPELGERHFPPMKRPYSLRMWGRMDSGAGE